jgi:hypothetical protein
MVLRRLFFWVSILDRLLLRLGAKTQAGGLEDEVGWRVSSWALIPGYHASIPKLRHVLTRHYDYEV